MTTHPLSIAQTVPIDWTESNAAISFLTLCTLGLSLSGECPKTNHYHF